MNETYEANIRIRDLPRRSDNILTALAALRNVPKWELVRDALVEFANNHKHELVEIGK